MVHKHWMYFAFLNQALLIIYAVVSGRWEFTLINLFICAIASILVYQDRQRSYIPPSYEMKEYNDERGIPIREFIINAPNGVKDMRILMEHDPEVENFGDKVKNSASQQGT